MTIEELRVLITAETRGLNNQINNVRGQLDRLTRSVQNTNNKISSSFKSLFKGFTVAAIVAGLVKVGKQAVSLASQLEEVQNVVDVSFGSMSAEVDKFAKQALKSFGMSELSAKRVSSTFMAMSNGLGVSSENGKNMSLQLTKLAGDMASFYNVSHDVAQTALSSVFTGETESLKKFGVVMTEANLKAFALSQGITKSYNAMSQAEKVTLRYNYVMNATAKAQGDFARTSGSWANQVTVLKEQFNQLLTILGKGLIAVLTPVLQVLNKFLGYLISIGNAIAKVFGGKVTNNTSTTISDASSAAGGLSDNVGAAEDGLKGADGAAKKLAKTLGSFDELQIMASQDSGSGGGSGGAGGGGAGGGGGGSISGVTIDDEEEVDGVANGIEKAMERIKAAFESLKPVFAAFVDALDVKSILDKLQELVSGAKTKLEAFAATLDFSKYIPALTEFAGALGSAFNTIVVGILDTAGTVFGDLFDAFSPVFTEFINNTIPMLIEIGTELIKTCETIFSSVKQVVDTVWTSIAPFFTLLGQVITDILQLLNKFWNEYGKPIFEKLREVIQQGGDTAEHVWNDIFAPICANAIKILNDLWSNHLKPLFDNVLGLIGDMAMVLLEYWNNVLLPFINWLVDTFGPFFVTVFTTIQDVVGTAIGVIVDIINGVVTVLRGVMEFLIGVFTGDWDRAWNGIQTIVEGVGNIFKTIVDGIIAVFNKMKDGVIAIANSFKDTFLKIFETIKNKISTIWNAIKDGVVTIVTGFKDKVVEVVTGFKDKLVELFTNIKDKIVEIVTAIKDKAVELWTAIKDKVVELVTNIKDKLVEMWTAIKTKVVELLTAIKDKAVEIWTAIRDKVVEVVTAIKTKIIELFTNIKDKVIEIATNIKNKVTDAFNTLKSGVTNAINTLKSTAVNVFQSIKSTLTNVADNIRTSVSNAFNTVRDNVVAAIQGIKNGIRAPINTVLGFFNSLIRGITSGINTMLRALNRINISVPDWVPGIGGQSFGFDFNMLEAPQIPLLAKGGVITQPTIAMMGEYAGASGNPEIVTPQNILRETFNESNVALVEALYQMCTQIVDAINNQELGVQIGDEVIASAAARGNNAYKQRTGAPLFV